MTDNLVVHINPKRKTRIWQHLVKHRISQEELAEKLDVSPAAVSYWLNGHREPAMYHVLQMFYITEGRIKISDFLCDVDRQKLVALAGLDSVKELV